MSEINVEAYAEKLARHRLAMKRLVRLSYGLGDPLDATVHDSVGLSLREDDLEAVVKEWTEYLRDQR